MTPPPFQPGLGPLHDLTLIQSQIRDPSYRFPPHITQDIRDSLGELPNRKCLEHVRRIICSLTPADLAGVDSWPDRPAGRVQVDVYGKTDDYGNWYVKIGIQKGLAKPYSCHFLEHDLVLKNGTILRKQP